MSTKTNFNLHQYPLLPYLSAYCLGILGQTFLFHFHQNTVLWNVTISLLIVVIALAYFPVFKFKHSIVFLGINSVFFTLAIGLTALEDPRNNNNWFGHYKDKSQYFLVELINAPEEKERTFLLNTKVIGSFYDNNWIATDGLLPIYVYKSSTALQYLPGQQLVIAAKLAPVIFNQNPGSFNYAEKLNKSGIYFQAFLSANDLFALKSNTAISKIESVRNHLLQQLDTFIPDPITQSLTKATLLNDTENMDAQVQKEYSNTGISHIIAISGMHVNLLFMLFLLPLFWWKDKRTLWIKYVIVLPIVWFYVAMCHFPPSAVRAAIGFSLIAIALILKRPQNAIHLLILNAFILLLANPNWLFHVGVQLSFLAVLSILIFYPIFRKWMMSKYIILNFIGETVALSLAVQVLVFPLVIFYFHQFPIWFLVANVFAAIFSVVQMFLAFLIMLTGVLNWSAVAGFVGKMLIVLTQTFNKFIAWLNEYTPDLSKMIPLNAMDYWLIMIAIVLLVIFWFNKQIVSLFVSIIVSLVFLGSLIYQDYTARQQNVLIVYSGAKQTLIDKINGKQSITIADSLNENIHQYILKPSNLFYRIHENELVQSHNLFWRIGDQKAVFINTADSFPNEKMNVLILNKNAALTIEELAVKLQPEIVVLDASWSRNAAIKYSDYLRINGFKVHNTQVNGAFILNSQ